MGKVWDRYGKGIRRVWERYKKGIGKVWERYGKGMGKDPREADHNETAKRVNVVHI